MITQFSGGRCDGSRVGVVSIPRYNVWNLSTCKRDELSASTFLNPGIWCAPKKILFLRQIRTFSRSNPSILVPFAVFLLKSHTLVIRHHVSSTLLFFNWQHLVLRPSTIGKILYACPLDCAASVPPCDSSNRNSTAVEATYLAWTPTNVWGKKTFRTSLLLSVNQRVLSKRSIPAPKLPGKRPAKLSLTKNMFVGRFGHCCCLPQQKMKKCKC